MVRTAFGVGSGQRRAPAVIGLLLLSLAAGGYYFARPGPNVGGKGWRAAQADSVREAVFRWQIERHRAAGQICFLTLEGATQARMSAFVRRFGNTPFVKALPSSQIQQAGSPMRLSGVRGFEDVQSGTPALHFSTGAIWWDSDTEAEVEGGGAAAMMSGDMGTFTVAWRGQRWTVTGYQVKAIS